MNVDGGNEAAMETEAGEDKVETKGDGKSTTEANTAAMDDPELDDEMKKIIANLAEKGPDGEIVKPSSKMVDKNGKHVSDMTPEEQKAWIEDRRKAIRDKKARDKAEKEKSSEKSRISMARAALDMQEQREEYQRQAFISAKKKEEKEKREAKKRIQEKIRLNKEERKKQAELRKIEADRIAALKK